MSTREHLSKVLGCSRRTQLKRLQQSVRIKGLNKAVRLLFSQNTSDDLLLVEQGESVIIRMHCRSHFRQNNRNSRLFSSAIWLSPSGSIWASYYCAARIISAFSCWSVGDSPKGFRSEKLVGGDTFLISNTWVEISVRRTWNQRDQSVAAIAALVSALNDERHTRCILAHRRSMIPPWQRTAPSLRNTLPKIKKFLLHYTR